VGQILLIAVYIACELIANVTASKPIVVFGFSAPGGVFVYALTFTLVDLINDSMGKRGARGVVYAAFGANALLALYSLLVLALPSPSFFTQQEAFATVLGSTPRIVAASLFAYLVSSLLDVEIFAFWKTRVRGPRWVRVLTSNAVSTGVDSALFVTAAFAGLLPLLPLIIGQYVIKMVMTFISLPLIYATRSLGERTDAAPAS
jgi:hypothetical protein